MRISSVLLLILSISLFSVGCGKSTTTETAVSNDQTETEIRADVKKFLTAVKLGSDKEIFAMMTPKAREVCSKDVIPGLPASDTAGFTIDEINIIAKDQAQVRTTMIDVDLQGNKIEDPLAWAVKKTDEGWRVAGIAFILFDGMEPIVFNFESKAEIDKAKEVAKAQAEAFNEEIIKMQAERSNLQPTTVSPNETLEEFHVGTTLTELPGN